MTVTRYCNSTMQSNTEYKYLCNFSISINTSAQQTAKIRSLEPTHNINCPPMSPSSRCQQGFILMINVPALLIKFFI